MDGHYLECIDPACPGCLPDDDAVSAMSMGAAKREAGRRGLPNVRALDTIAAVLADAPEYRERSAAARAERFTA